MTNYFFNLPHSTQQSILKGAETKLNIKAQIIEKDIWICWTLDNLFKLPINMAFKGGTSLSKGYNLIDRFSEDVDITIDYNEFLPDIDLTKSYSNSQLKKIRDQLKTKLKQYTTEIVVPHFHDCIKKEFEGKFINIKIEDEGEKIYIDYPITTDSHNNYINSSILLEFGGCNSIHPNDKKEITTLLSEINSDLVLPVANINILSPLRTFWEKATLIHVECHRGRIKDSPDRLSRHWYDLAKLNNSWVSESALKSKDILNEVLIAKKAFFNAAYANYDKCQNGQFCLIPQELEIEKLRDDYNNMIEAGMFTNSLITFDDLMKDLRSLEIEINQI